MTDELVGLKVAVEVQEGMPEDLVTLNGTITMSLGSPTNGEYVVVRLNQSVKWGLATGLPIGLPQLTLENLIIWPVFQGDSMSKLLEHVGRNIVPCGIGNLLVEPRQDMTIDKSNVTYFSRGVIRKA